MIPFTGSPPPTIEWKRGGVGLPGVETTANLTRMKIEKAKKSDQGPVSDFLCFYIKFLILITIFDINNYIDCIRIEK